MQMQFSSVFKGPVGSTLIWLPGKIQMGTLLSYQKLS